MKQKKNYCEQLRKYAISPCTGVKVEPFSLKKLPDEAHIDSWKMYLKGNASNDWLNLQSVFGLFNIPIREGISKTDEYAAVIKRGEAFSKKRFGKKFSLRKPDLFHCNIHDHSAGALPVLTTQDREDFEDLFRMGGYRSEPVPVNPSVNALMVSGLINWQRVFSYRDRWLKTHKKSRSPDTIDWSDEMLRIFTHEPQLFKDRYILVMKAPYSSVDVHEIDWGGSEEEWLQISFRIRLEHEFTHYAVKRIFNVMRSHVWDEVIADFMGITFALNDFHPGLFLRFFGLDTKGQILPNARIRHYTQYISPDLVQKICELLVDVSSGLKNFYLSYEVKNDRMKLLYDLSQLSLLEMAEQ